MAAFLDIAPCSLIDTTFQKTAIFILVAVRTSNLINLLRVCTVICCTIISLILILHEVQYHSKIS
jgi:hypothetical protein